MSKYILVYNVNEYPDMGGGIHFEDFETEQELDKRVSEVMPEHEIFAVGELKAFEYKAIDWITKVQRIS